MIFRLLAFIIGYAVLLGAPVAAIGYAVHRALGPSRERKRTKKLAAQHAKLLRAHEEQRCFCCDEYCTEEDCYEEGKGWYHFKCLKQLLEVT